MANIQVDYIDHLGNDLTVVNAARVSFDKKSDNLSEKDKKLITYLASHNHWTPFSHPQITLRYTVPITVARQETKHTVGFSRNEVSRRYVTDEPQFYSPKAWRSAPDGNMKQGSGDRVIVHLNPDRKLDEVYNYYCETSLEFYNELLSIGIAPEMARMVLPQSGWGVGGYIF